MSFILTFRRSDNFFFIIKKKSNKKLNNPRSTNAGRVEEGTCWR